MTRENKLALVVGFGLVLFVGILISDHFSAARQQQGPSLLPIQDPLAVADGRDVYIPVTPARETPMAAEVTQREDDRRRPPEQRGGSTPAGPMNSSSGIEIQQPDLHGDDQYTGVVPGEVAHHLKKGETLTSVVRDHYGDSALVPDIARYNEISDPNNVRSGRRLRLPPRHILRGGAQNQSSPSVPAASKTPAPKTYTVRGDDTLSDLARRFLGSAGKWRQLYNANKDVIKDPDVLTPGITIRIPTR